MTDNRQRLRKLLRGNPLWSQSIVD